MAFLSTHDWLRDQSIWKGGNMKFTDIPLNTIITIIVLCVSALSAWVTMTNEIATVKTNQQAINARLELVAEQQVKLRLTAQSNADTLKYIKDNIHK